jgi:hypothetical protein
LTAKTIAPPPLVKLIPFVFLVKTASIPLFALPVSRYLLHLSCLYCFTGGAPWLFKTSFITVICFPSDCIFFNKSLIFVYAKYLLRRLIVLRGSPMRAAYASANAIPGSNRPTFSP